MKITHILSALTASFFAFSQAQADQNWNGGSANWDVGTTPAWNGANTWTESYDPGTSTVTGGGDGANFLATGGTVTIDDSQPGGSVAADHLYFQNNNGGAYTLTGDTLYTTGGYSSSLINADTGSGPVTINNDIFHVGGDNQYIQNNSSSDLTFNGTLDYDHQTTLFMDASGTGKIVFNGTIANAQESGLYLIGGGTYEFGPTANLTSLDSTHNGSNLSLADFAGTTLLDSDPFLSTSVITQYGGNGIFTNGAFTGTQLMVNERASGVLGGLAAVASGWSGGIYLDNNPATTTLSQVAGGRFTYSGNIFGNNATYLITSGTGTVILSSATSYTGNNTLAADLTAKRTLLTNSVGTSPFGGNSGAVQVESGATLGGTGYVGVTHIVVTAGPGSIIAPGDSGADGGTASIGTLTLDGGLDTSHGVTMDFKIDGPNNDELSFGDGDFAPTGTLTLNFFNMGDGITQNVFYPILAAGGNFDLSGATFNYVAPYGYFVSGTSDSLGVFSVEFQEAPEPSTYALMLGGLGFLTFCLLRKNRASV